MKHPLRSLQLHSTSNNWTFHDMKNRRQKLLPRPRQETKFAFFGMLFQAPANLFMLNITRLKLPSKPAEIAATRADSNESNQRQISTTRTMFRMVSSITHTFVQCSSNATKMDYSRRRKQHQHKQHSSFRAFVLLHS